MQQFYISYLVFIITLWYPESVAYLTHFGTISNSHFQNKYRSKGSFEKEDDGIFGAEFLFNNQKKKKIVKIEYIEKIKENIAQSSIDEAAYREKMDIKQSSLQKFNNVRKTFLLDSLFFSVLGLSIAWYFGTFKDAYSYLVGAGLGIIYAGLLGNYVQTIGSQESSRGGSVRYLPVIVLILLYGKYKATFSIIPEIVGFFSFQLASLFQVFNEQLYDDDDDDDKNSDELEK